MSPGSIKGVADSLPKAAVTFDKFHAVKIVNEAVDQMRRTERKVHKLLAGTRRDIWLPAIQRTCPIGSAPYWTACRCVISRPDAPTRSGWRSRNSMSNSTTKDGEAFLKRWYFWATHSR